MNDLVASARRLARAGRTRPAQADLRRSVSAAYYALFHAMAKGSADMLVGVGTNRPRKAWLQAYRSLDHAAAKVACRLVKDLDFPPAIKRCALAFPALQDERHRADYDPAYRTSRTEALATIDLVEAVIRDLAAAPRRDRVAFAVLLLLKRRP